jgi:hypothetical protein
VLSTVKIFYFRQLSSRNTQEKALSKINGLEILNRTKASIRSVKMVIIGFNLEMITLRTKSKFTRSRIKVKWGLMKIKASISIQKRSFKIQSCLSNLCRWLCLSTIKALVEVFVNSTSQNP